jgi:3-hydroxyisobutyrate dehydrogenase-like beta-hydroxyacid dehydrogenase
VKPTLGFVGIGNIGEPVCRHLLDKGYELLIYDVNPEALVRLKDTSAEPAASLETLASKSDVVLLSLPNSDIVEEVVFGEGGLEDGLSAGKTRSAVESCAPEKGRLRSWSGGSERSTKNIARSSNRSETRSSTWATTAPDTS